MVKRFHASEVIEYWMASPSRSVSFPVLESLRSIRSVSAFTESRMSMLCASRDGSLSLTLVTLTVTLAVSAEPPSAAVAEMERVCD